MVFGLGRKQHKVKVTARGRGTAPPPELLVPNAMITPANMMPAPMATMMAPMAPVVAPTYSTVTSLPAPVAPPMAPPVVAAAAPVVTTETFAVQYPTESRVMPYAPAPIIEETIVQQQALPEAPIELSIQRVPPPLPAGYESDEEFLRNAKYATQNATLEDDDNSSYTSFEEEVYCIVPPGVRPPRDLPLNSYRHGYRVRGGPEVIDQYYEGSTPSPRQQLPRRSELYSYTDIPVAATRNSRYSPSPRMDALSTRAYRTAERFDQPSPNFNQRNRFYQ
jgi:hypothetical protein